MERLRLYALAAGRALVLLAAMTLALVPALPAHAHLHRAVGAAADSAHASHDHGRVVAAMSGEVADEAGGAPSHAGDCCFVSHVSVMPTAAAVPLPLFNQRDLIRGSDWSAPPDAPGEALPKPPRPFA